MSSSQKSKLPIYLSLALVTGVIICYFVIPGFKDFLNTAWDVLTSNDEKKTQAWINQFGYFGPVIIILAMIAQMFLLVIPSPLLMVVAVLAYGPFWGSLVILAAVFSASSVGYWIGAYFGAPLVEKLLGAKSERKIERFIEDYGFGAVIVARLSPFLSNDAISFVGGILHMGYWKYIGATLVGILPLTLLIAYLGQSIERLQSGLVWTSIICIVLFVGYVIYDKKITKK